MKSASSTEHSGHWISKAMRLLHLSDLHFGMMPARRDKITGISIPSKTAHAFTRGGRPDPERLAQILADDPNCQQPDIVVISGDLGWTGVAEDYAYASNFLAILRRTWPMVPLVLVPGNHDVDRNGGPTEDDQQNAFVDMLRTLYRSDFERLYPFYAAAPDGISSRQRLVTVDRVGDDALIVGVNSAAALAKESTPVFVDPDLLGMIQRHLSGIQIPSQALRVFVIHHHLFPFTERPFGEEGDAIETRAVYDKPDQSIVANSAKLQAWLAVNGFHLVLHGHKHLSHGRYDVLWRADDPPEGRPLFVVGAGSSGVEAQHRGHEEPLTYNVLEARRLSKATWDLQVAVRKITDAHLVWESADHYKYGAPVGPNPDGFIVFRAERMDECHRVIAASVREGRPILNFLSIVSSHEYQYPETIRIGERKPAGEEVERSFHSLHPEWDPQRKWDDISHVDHVLRDLPTRYQFQHGPRLFGILGRAGASIRGAGGNERALRPLWHAVDSLIAPGSSGARAYVGLYNPDIDLAQREPLPGLMSVQFVPNGDALDVVATFRKLELSFWWVVNMLELGELLVWAARQDLQKRKPGRITFFAAIAEWKADPQSTFVSQLDGLSTSDLLRLVLTADRGDSGASQHLASLLEDQLQTTNEENIDVTGLERLTELVKGLCEARADGASLSLISPRLLQQLVATTAAMQTAIAHREERVRKLTVAKQHLSLAISDLREQTPH